jgi:HK97 family phage portal protein
MGLLTSLLTGQPIGATYHETDDFWYRADPRMGGGGDTMAGYPVGPDTALRQSTVNACVGLISDMVGSLPLHVYRRLDNGGKERATGHPAYTLLHRRPNQRQTPKEWLTMGTQHLLLRGNFYNEVVLDRRFAAAELRPLHPDRVKCVLLDSDRRGYVYRPPKGPERTLTQDEMFHVMGPYSLDNGVTGCSVIEFARESIGAAHAQEGFAANFWRHGAEGHLVFVAPNALNAQSRDANEKVLRERMAGWQNAHKVMLLEGGAKPERITTTARDSQYIETQKFSAQRLCQFFRVSPDMVGINDGTSQWGTGIEARMMGFLKFTLMPYLIAFQQRAALDIIDDPSLFAEFLTDAILQADTVARFNAYGVAIMNGIMSENEVRVRENLNPRPGLDEPRRSANQDRGGDPRGPRQDAPPARRPAPPDDDDDADDPDARARRITLVAAQRLVRREVMTIRKWAPRYANDEPGWRKWVAEFYGGHATELETVLALDTAMAREYCAARCAAICPARVETFTTNLLDEYERDAPATLTALALEGVRQP